MTRATLALALLLSGCAAHQNSSTIAGRPPPATESTMNPNIAVLTLGVDDLQRALSFYRDGLGFPTKGIVGTEFEDGAVVFFHMDDRLILALYPRRALAKDANVSVSSPAPSDISLGHLVASKAAVDAVMERAQKAGATITDSARDRFWGGYSGYFQDPDGHLWEILWNPHPPTP